jgi:hydroxypyruvate isomerase
MPKLNADLTPPPACNGAGIGEMNYPILFGFIDRIGYDGWIGCEYKPKGKTVDGLVWVSAHLGA